MGTVYLDILVGVNWIIDYFLLLGTAAAALIPTRRIRLILGAGLGGISALIFLAPELSAQLQVIYQVVSGTGVLIVALRFDTLRQFFRAWAWFFLFNLCYSGLVLAAVMRFSAVGIYRNNRAFYFDVSPALLLGCILVMYVLLRFVLFVLERPAAVEKYEAVLLLKQTPPVQICLLADSGLAGQDFLLNRPLLVLSYPDIRKKTGQVGGAFQQLKQYFDAAVPLQTGQLPVGWYLLPIHTAAGDTLAPATAARLRGARSTVPVTVAFVAQRIHDGTVQGLISARHLEQMKGALPFEKNNVFRKEKTAR